MLCLTLVLGLLFTKQALTKRHHQHHGHYTLMPPPVYSGGITAVPTSALSTSATLDNLQTTVPTTSTTSAHPVQPTFVLRDAEDQEVTLWYEEYAGDKRGFPYFRSASEVGNTSIFTLARNGNLVHISPELPTTNYVASGTEFYPFLFREPGSVFRLCACSIPNCTCSIDEDTLQLDCDCGGLTRFCIYPSRFIFPCNGSDAISSELFLYATPIASNTTTPASSAPSSTKSGNVAQPTFKIQDAGQTRKLAVSYDRNNINGKLGFPVATRLGENDTWTLNDKGNIVHVGPGSRTEGFILWGLEDRDFELAHPEHPEFEYGEGSKDYSPYTYTIDPITSRLTCNQNASLGICFIYVESFWSCAEPFADIQKIFWFAVPVDPPTPAATVTSTQSPQPTFRIQDAQQKSELYLDYSFVEPTSSIIFVKFGPVGAQPGVMPLFTLNERGNLIYVTPGTHFTGFHAYGVEFFPFRFGDPDPRFRDVFEDDCVCSIDSVTSQLSCNCAGVTVNCLQPCDKLTCLDECDPWHVFPVDPDILTIGSSSTGIVAA
ncbi:hypothetical protein PFICI_02375 [Pestalotiopsis fici W106-1]|uniref:Uncharacterized protein n=1 Tax=Pestalotiopsis fici (strain W106-1 / CGMCC3.15140) TaxID=1229662 RepID=W3XE78_PESFW|nr:uncharacterized protein PFICI_02375 [Pestalotiopsis fici W106-1]ETS84350.1 hypothetical protein PFICI_02375 [Pestalotiopsis fici W106-1]